MITLLKQDSFSKALMLVGLETDTKPTEYFTFKGAVLPIRNGSTFYEADTATFYIYDGDSDTWIKQSGGGGYPEPTGTVQITQNGVGIDVKDYAEADVAVPNTYGVGDEGKVVDNGALVSQTSKNIGANGTVDTTKNNEVVVAVPNTYAAADEGKVVSNGGLVSQSSRNISSNGTIDTTLNNEVVVNVPDTAAGVIEGSLSSLENLQATSVKNYKFQKDYNLTSVNLPAVTNIGDYAFSQCQNLRSISVGNVVSIGSNALSQTKIEGLIAPYLESVGSYAFYNCQYLSTFYAPLLETISNDVFASCINLESITLESLETIDIRAFSACSKLKSADFHVVGIISNQSFYNCSNLDTLILRKTDSICTLGAIQAFTFTKILSGNGFIYVPASLIDSYKQATNWSTFPASVWRALEDYTVDGTTTGALDPNKI